MVELGCSLLVLSSCLSSSLPSPSIDDGPFLVGVAYLFLLILLVLSVFFLS